MIGQNNNNSNNASKGKTGITLEESILETPRILELKREHTIKQNDTLAKMKEYQKWFELAEYVKENFLRTKVELAECDARELEAFINLYQEKIRVKESKG